MNQETKQVIYNMLTESTGTYFLDSGGEDGRHWQRNQKDLNISENEEYISKDDDYITKFYLSLK